jgi:hypothetical protein
MPQEPAQVGDRTERGGLQTPAGIRPGRVVEHLGQRIQDAVDGLGGQRVADHRGVGRPQCLDGVGERVQGAGPGQAERHREGEVGS